MSEYEISFWYVENALSNLIDEINKYRMELVALQMIRWFGPRIHMFYSGSTDNTARDFKSISDRFVRSAYLVVVAICPKSMYMLQRRKNNPQEKT